MNEKAERRKHELHRRRHVRLHAAFDELLADFIAHQPPGAHGFMARPIEELMRWSHKQTVDPDEKRHD